MRTGLALTALAAGVVMSIASAAEAGPCVRCDGRGCRVESDCGAAFPLPPQVCEILELVVGNVECPSSGR